MKKMKVLSRILLIVLSMVLVFSSTACSDPNGADDLNQLKYNGTHVKTAELTDKYIVHNGITEYKVVIPENATDIEKKAQSEFSSLFKTATNISLVVVNDKNLSYDENAKIISIGKTKLLADSGIDTSAVLDLNGCRIVTKGNGIYIWGGSEKGVIWGVYDFMEICFNYETIIHDCMIIDKNVSDVRLRNFDVTDIPDFKYIAGNSYTARSTFSDYDYNQFIYRSKVNGERFDLFRTPYKYWREEDLADPEKYNKQVNGSTNTASIMSTEDFPDKAQIWFSNRGNQWCYTARGNEEELDAMTFEVAQKVIRTIKMNNKGQNNYVDRAVITITQEDGSGECYCSACQESVEKYGSHGGSLCIFFNKVSKIVDEWRSEQLADESNEFYDACSREYHLIFFAYGWSLEPPTKINESGDIVPVDESVVLRDSLGIYLAYSVHGGDFEHDQNYKTNNAAYKYSAWSIISPYILTWDYAANFQNALYPYFDDKMNTAYYQYLAAMNNTFLYNEMPISANGAVNWYEMKTYLYDQMRYDSSQNPADVVRHYFECVYEIPELVEAMYNFYLSERAYYKIVSARLVVDINESTAITTSDYPQGTIRSWIAQVDAAMEILKAHKDELSDKRYTEIYRSVEKEAIAPMFMLCELYGKGLNANELAGYAQRMLNFINDFGMNTSNTTISLGYSGRLNAEKLNQWM